jgi:ABC-type bacteriocin/lantibiotic exporter with double-glycine peptidase domain
MNKVVFTQSLIIHFIYIIISWILAPIWLIILLNAVSISSILFLFSNINNCNNKDKEDLQDANNSLLITYKSIHNLKEYAKQHKKEEEILLNKISKIVNSVKE